MANTQDHKQEVARITADIHELFADGFQTSDAVDIVFHAMRLAELSGVMTGPEKKLAVIAAVKSIMAEHDASPVLQAMLPSLIDTMIQFDKSQIRINPAIEQGFRSCRDRCC